MDIDLAEEVSRERATSSEPFSTRPNPFDDDAEQSSRKRQRVSSGGSRSRSVDTVRTPIGAQDHTSPNDDDREGDTTSLQPQTPSVPSAIISSTEPTSSKVTINLRMNRNINSASESPPSPQTPSKDANDVHITERRVDLDLTHDQDATTEPIEITSSSPSAVGSPKVELIVVDDEVTYRNMSPEVAIIEDDQIVDDDPTLAFPYNDETESLVTTIRKIVRFFEYESVDTEEAFLKLRDWIYAYLRMSNDHERVWYENHEKHSDFWDQLPEIIWALHRRKSFFGPFLSKSKNGRRALTELFVQFARLTARFVAMDVRVFSKLKPENVDTEPSLFSRPYLSTFAYLLKKDESPHIGRNLESHYRWNWDDDMALMMNHFLSAGGSVAALLKLNQAQLSLLSRFPKIVDDLTEPGRIVTRAVNDAAFILRDAGSPHQQHIEVAKRILNQGYEYFQVMSHGLVQIIEKHVTFLNPDAALSHIVGLTQLLNMSLNLEGSPASDLLQQHQKLHPDLPKVYTATVIATEWKFEMLKKLIVSGQMQLRVSGVTTLCQELLTMFTKYKREDTAKHPLLLHFAYFILQNKLVDYIVGIDSHREIISESANIVGFLVATKTYTTQQTDIIWKTVMTSPDPRVVEAILRMLIQILNLQDYEALLYLCKKACEVPLDAFTGPMREYCERLLYFLLVRATGEKVDCLDAPPFELCVRLMREASVPQPGASVGALDIQIFASARLRELIPHGPSSEVRNEIYLSCISDISERSPTASGSICALYILLHHSMAKDLHVLTTNHGLTRLMIEEFDNANKVDQAASVPTNIKSPARQARRDLLLAIILNEPSTITPELGERLWNLFVGNDARSYADREIAWQLLNSAAKKISTRNVFIATCFKEYLPRLEPRCYTIGSLDFTREAIQASLREAQGDLLDEDQAANSHGIEQLWRMILTAPQDTIEAPAITMLVELYLDSPIVLSMPRSRAHQLQLSVINRCLRQLSSAATKLRAYSDGTTSGDDEPMIIVASDEQVQEQELFFTRSLLLLREFLRLYQSKSQFAAPKPHLPIFGIPDEVKGENLDLKYQAFDGDKCEEIKTLQIGGSNTVADFFAAVGRETSFKGFKVYHWGREIDFNNSVMKASIADVQLGKGLVLVVRRDEKDQDGKAKDGASNLETEIINHFDEFWDYLGMEERLSKEIYHFLVKFPAYHKLLTAFEDESTSLSDVFTLGQPFKCLYAVYALREYLTVKAREGKIDENIMSRAIGLIVSAIVNSEVLDSCANADLRELLAQSLVDCLIQFLPEPGSNTSLTSHLHPILLSRLLQLLYDAAPKNADLVASIFEAILEASLHSPQFWTAFISSPDTPRLLRRLLLEDSRIVLRKSIMKQIISKCSFTPSLSTLSTIDLTVAFWSLLKEMVPLAVKQQDRCEETLTLTLLIFRKLADTSIDSVDLEECLLSWGALMVNHESIESVGHPEIVDAVARGLASLLYWCSSFSKASTRPLPSNGLAVALFSKHMFPELSDEEGGDSIKECIPLLNTATRKLLADTVVYLTRDDREQYTEILHHLLGLLPYSPDEENPYVLELGFAFDRSKAIRSSTGYVGLRNLSNTCYLNSLFTQLFMNVSFRRFMLNANIADGASQKLLYETQKLFAFMQNSFKRFIDPSSLAGSIRTYDDSHIDVSIQMDVDEFYNLLFDRWESQILSAADKRQFRSFYGGQLVQQVKSKECPHISERLEPFSAIQCDIKGKSTLQESLQAYVDGEAMEGDNKYKCSTCDRHVNAVKRACLKEVPDNLIFHLKRFDFNLRTMQRSKINDYFSFPHTIDMRPYKVEHLMETPDESPEDLFELVGILVHSGTAESGHYYSYIRERPSTDQTPNWVEFNDDHVTPFDPASIEANCFGGVEYRGPEAGSFSFDKSWSAYMLFYQRSSVLKEQQQSLIASSRSHPLRLPIRHDLRNFIATENELLIRKFCLYDEFHAPFVLRMIDNVQSFNQGQCSEDHGLERLAMSIAMFHLDQVVARAKDTPDFGNYMLALCHKFQACTDCCRDFLEWLIDHPEAFRQLLFRNPDYTVRSEIVAAIILALSMVKRHDTYAYGLYEETDHQDDMDSDDFDSPRLYMRLLEILHRFWESFHLSVRAWPEYFGLLTSMAQLGNQETAQMLDAGFFRKVLEVLTADSAFPPHPQYTRMLAIIQKRPVNRPVQLENVILLLEILLKACDLSLDPVGIRELRIELAIEDEALPINEDEHNLLSQHWTRSDVNILVEKLLAYNQNEKSTLSIIRMLLTGGFEDGSRSIFNAIRVAIRKGTSTSSAPALRAALVYCQYMDDYSGISRMINHISNVTNALSNSEGREHLRFFKDLLEIPNNNAGIDHDEFFRFILEQIPFWAPCLLMYYDPVVRADTEDYLQQVLIAHAAEPDPNTSEEARHNAQAVLVVARNLGLACLRYLNIQHVEPRTQVVKASLLSIQAIIELCRPLYDENSDDEIDIQFRELYESVFPALKKLIVEEADEDVSEWENSDDAFSSSEVMDSITELCGTVGGDLNDVDV